MRAEKPFPAVGACAATCSTTSGETWQLPAPSEIEAVLESNPVRQVQLVVFPNRVLEIRVEACSASMWPNPTLWIVNSEKLVSVDCFDLGSVRAGPVDRTEVRLHIVGGI